MARWMSEATKAKLKQLVEEGVERRKIIARLGITEGQYSSQCLRMGLDPKKSTWGLCKIYYDLQGRRRKK